MLSVNQINAQVKLTDMWKSSNVPNYPIQMEKINGTDVSGTTRAIARGDLMIKGSTSKSQSTFLNDASKIWNKAPLSIKLSDSLYTAKKIKKFVSQLPR